MNEKNVKITKQAHAFKNYASSHNVEILNHLNPKLQLKDTKSAIKKKLKKLLTGLTGFTFLTILVLVIKKMESESKTKYNTFYSHSKAETIINDSDIDDNVIKSVYDTVISTIQNFLGKRSGYTTD